MASTTYYWDEIDDNVCCEEDENGDITASYTHEAGLYGEVIAQKRGDNVRYFNFDGDGNTSELTDEDENVTDTYEYSAFGEEVARTGTTVNPFGYKGALGYYTNGDVGDMYVRARTYEPTIAKWLSLDPATWFRTYTYAFQNPLLYSDPSGAIPCHATCRESHDFHCDLTRGQFKNHSVGHWSQMGIDPVGDELTSSMVASWAPSVSQFLEKGCCKCCCEEVAFAQIEKATIRYASPYGFLGWLHSNDWRVDKSLPYSPHNKATPCNYYMDSSGPTVRGGPAKMDDTPGQYMFFRKGILTTYYKHEFETCVYCSAGREALVSGLLVRMNVYGCFTWSHEFEWRYGPVYRVKKCINGGCVSFTADFSSTPNRNWNTKLAPAAGTGTCPSPVFWTTVAAYIGRPLGGP